LEVKVEFSVPTIKIHGRMVVQLHRFLTSALVWIVIGQFHAPIGLSPGENAPFMHCIWGWMEPSAWSGRLPLLEMNHDSLVFQLLIFSLYRLSYPISIRRLRDKIN